LAFLWILFERKKKERKEERKKKFMKMWMKKESRSCQSKAAVSFGLIISSSMDVFFSAKKICTVNKNHEVNG